MSVESNNLPESCGLVDSDMSSKRESALQELANLMCQHTPPNSVVSLKFEEGSAWEDLGNRPCKVPHGFVSGKGEFYQRITEVPFFHNSMMVFKTS